MRAPKLLLPLLILLVAPAAASAADYYAAPSPTGNDANTCLAGHPCATISHVVGLAGVHDGDTVHLAAGTYDESVLTAKRLTFAGAGPGTPTSTAGASVIHAPGPYSALDLSGGGTVQDVRLRGHDATGGNETFGAQLESTSGAAVSYTVRRVVAIGGRDNTANVSQLAIWITSQNAGSTLSADVQDLYATSALQDGVALQLQAVTGAHATATLTRATLVSGTSGTGLQGDGSDFPSLTLVDSTVQAAGGSRAVTTDGPLAIVRSSVSGGDDGVVVSGAGPLSIIDSLVASAPTTSAREALDIDADGAGPTSVLIKGSTIVTKSTQTPLSAISMSTQAGSGVNAQLIDSIARARKPDGTALANGYDIRSLAATGRMFNIIASHSSFSSVAPEVGTTLPAPGSGTNVAGDPGFVSWTAGNYALLASSPLIDRGDPAAVTPGELDLVHQSRSLDGNGDCIARPDVGAYELAGHAGAVPHPTISGPVLARRGGPVPFTATPAAGYALTWTFSGGGTATGPSVSHVYTAGGTQSATVTATRLGCVGHATHTLTVDGTAPKLSGLSVKKKKLRFKLSEAASVVVTVLVRKAHHHKYTVLGTFKVAGKKGSNSKALPKKLHGHKLKAGHYEVKLRATDPVGNRGSSKTKTFTL